MTIDHVKKIAELNDLCRTTMGIAGRIGQTEGIRTLPSNVQSAIREKVERFDTFTPENDPFQEHDFGSFEHTTVSGFSGKSITTIAASLEVARTRAIPRGPRAC